MEKTIRIAIFGGLRGMSYYDPIMAIPGFTICAVCEQNPETRKSILEKVGHDTVVCEDFDTLLEQKPDAVILANYFHEHCKYAIRAMEAGIDVISETTAAPTPGEALDLLECCEKTGRKYMLAANCPTMVGPLEMTRRYREGKLGDVLYAEAEYFHNLEGHDEQAAAKQYYPTETHWRRFIPSPYYNMHSMGVLMAATGLLPKRVTAMEIQNPAYADSLNIKTNRTAGGIALYEMENGAIFRSTGWCDVGPDGKWFRLSCQNGTVETERLNQDRILYRPYGEPAVSYDPAEQYTEEEKLSGHGGADARICRQICDYLSGVTAEPIFDLYRAVTLSLAGIYAFYSILEGKTFSIPDVKDKAAREVLRGDYRSTFPDENDARTLPCCRKEAAERN